METLGQYTKVLLRINSWSPINLAKGELKKVAISLIDGREAPVEEIPKDKDSGLARSTSPQELYQFLITVGF